MEKSVNTVMLAEGTLRSIVFASRPGIATATKVDDCFEGHAVKVVAEGLAEGDYVVRSVRAGNRRFVQILAGTMPTIEGATHADANRVDVADGDAVFLLSGATLVAAPKNMIIKPGDLPAGKLAGALATDIPLVCVDETTLRNLCGGSNQA